MAENIRIIGHTSVILVVNMNQFIADTREPNSRRRFERIRGTDRLARVLQLDWANRFQTIDHYADQLRKTTPFFRADSDGDSPQMSTDETGFVTGMFRHNMLTDYSAPEYWLNKDAIRFDASLARNYQFRRLVFDRIWKQWDIFIRPTVTGMFVVRMARHYDRMQTLTRVARDVLDLQQSFDLLGAMEQYHKIDSDTDLSPEEKAQRRQSVDVLLNWLRIDPQYPPSPGYIPVQWQLALEVCHRFIESVGKEIVPASPEPNGVIHLDKSQHNFATQLNDHYVVYQIDELITSYSREKPYRIDEQNPWHVFPKDIKFQHENMKRAKRVAISKVQQALVNLLEGAMLRRQDTQVADHESLRYFPSHTRSVLDRVFNNEIATWEDELCLMTARTTIVMPSHRSREAELYVSTLPSTDTTSVMYRDYWQAFERMVEFIAEVQVLAQLLERESLIISQNLVDRLRDIRYGMLQGQMDLKPRELTEQVEEAANLVRLVAMCQSLTTPHVWSRAEYAVDKAECLLKEMQVARILAHAERNVSSLTRFVDHIDELYIAEQSERSNQSTNRVSTLLGIVSLSVILFSLPSFWRDSQEIDDSVITSQILTTEFISAVALAGTVLAILLAVMSIGLILYMAIQRRRRRRH